MHIEVYLILLVKHWPWGQSHDPSLCTVITELTSFSLWSFYLLFNLRFTWPIDSKYCVPVSRRVMLKDDGPSVGNKTDIITMTVTLPEASPPEDVSWSAGQKVGRAWSLWNRLAAPMLLNILCLDPKGLLFFFLCMIHEDCHSSPRSYHDAEGYMLYFLRHCMMAVPEGSKAAEAVLGECYSAQGAISSMLSVGKSPCSKSCSKIPLILCQKNLPVSVWKEARELRAVWRTLAHRRSGTSRGAKLLKYWYT